MTRLLALLCVCACTTPPRDVSLFVGINQPHAPTFIRYRDGDGAWKTPPRAVDGTYTLRVTDDFEAVVVCVEDSGTFDVEELRATVDDGTVFKAFPGTPMITGSCAESGGTTNPAPTFTLRGATTQAADVAVAGYPFMTTVQQPAFTATVPAGEVSVFATDAMGMQRRATRLVRRVVDVSADVDIGTIDLDSEALAVTTRELPMTGAMGPAFFSVSGPQGIDLVDEGSAATPLAFPVIDPTQQSADDSYETIVSVDAGTVNQIWATSYGNRADSVDLIPPPTVMFATEPLAATWANDGVSTAVLDAQEDGGGNRHDVTATPGWLSRTHTTTLSFATDIPGADPAWTMVGGSMSFSLERSLGLAATQTHVSP